MFDPDKIAQDVVHQMNHYLNQLLRSLPNENTATSPLAEGIRLLVRVANGDIPADMADDIFIEQVSESVDFICQRLFSSPGNPHHYQIPSQFWDTQLGQVIRHCQLWLRGDDLITYTEAASILWPDADVQTARMRIKRMVERGELSAYADPTESNPQHAMRVSRLEIEQHRY